MKLKYLLIVVLALSVSACGFRKKDEVVDDLSADIESINTGLISAPLLDPLPQLPPLNSSALTSSTLASGRTAPIPIQEPFSSNAGNYAPLGAPVVSAPITATPQINVGTQEALRAEAGDRVFFQTGSAELDPRAQAILSSVAAWLNQNQQRSLSIEGHADERGTREYNLALGERRATAVKSYLASKGVSSERLNALSFGKERPASGGSNPQAWALNRRSVFIVR